MITRLRLGIVVLFACICTISFIESRFKIGSENIENNAKEFTHRFLNQQRKYLLGGSLEHITFQSQESEDSEKTIMRHGTLYKNPNAQGIVVVCHGIMCDKYDIAFLRRSLLADYNVMMFDFRAHGENVNDEQCCTFGKDEAFDVIGAVNYIKSREDLKNMPRMAYAFSMGAVAAIQAQAQTQAPQESLFRLMILDCPYDHSKNIIKCSVEKLNITLFGYTFEVPGRHLLEKFAFNVYVQWFLKALLKTVANMDATGIKSQMYPLSPVDSIKKITIPCLFIHCKNDEKVPVQSAEALYNNAQGYKRLWVTQGRRHFDSIFYNPEKYIYKVNKFIRQVLNGELYNKVYAKVDYDA